MDFPQRPGTTPEQPNVRFIKNNGPLELFGTTPKQPHVRFICKNGHPEPPRMTQNNPMSILSQIMCARNDPERPQNSATHAFGVSQAVDYLCILCNAVARGTATLWWPAPGPLRPLLLQRC